MLSFCQKLVVDQQMVHYKESAKLPSILATFVSYFMMQEPDICLSYMHLHLTY